MRLGLFEITGGTGTQVARLALDRGDEFTVVVRRPAAVAVAGERLRASGLPSRVAARLR